MNHLPLIIKREYLTKVRNKSFILMTFLSPLIMIGLFFFIGYLSNINNDTVRTIYVLDDTGFVSETFKTTDYTIYNLLSEVDFENLDIKKLPELEQYMLNRIYLLNDNSCILIIMCNLLYSKVLTILKSYYHH